MSEIYVSIAIYDVNCYVLSALKVRLWMCGVVRYDGERKARTEGPLGLVPVVPPAVLREVVGGVGPAAGVGPDLVVALQEGLLRTAASFRGDERAAVAIALADLAPDVS